jgi:hypothetical protein
MRWELTRLEYGVSVPWEMAVEASQLRRVGKTSSIHLDHVLDARWTYSCMFSLVSPRIQSGHECCCAMREIRRDLSAASPCMVSVSVWAQPSPYMAGPGPNCTAAQYCEVEKPISTLRNGIMAVCLCMVNGRSPCSGSREM